MLLLLLLLSLLLLLLFLLFLHLHTILSPLYFLMIHDVDGPWLWDYDNDGSVVG